MYDGKVSYGCIGSFLRDALMPFGHFIRITRKRMHCLMVVVTANLLHEVFIIRVSKVACFVLRLRTLV